METILNEKETSTKQKFMLRKKAATNLVSEFNKSKRPLYKKNYGKN